MTIPTNIFPGDGVGMLIAVASVTAIVAYVATRKPSKPALPLDPNARLRQLGEDAARADQRLNREIDLQLSIEDKVSEARNRRKAGFHGPKPDVPNPTPGPTTVAPNAIG